MGEIDSPIGKTTFQSQPMKSWTVADETSAPSPEVYEDLTPEQANQLRREFAARAAAGGAGGGGGDGDDPPPPPQTTIRGGVPGKRRLEILLNIGRGRKDVPLKTDNGTYVFSLRTLKGREQREVATTAEQLKRIRSETGEYVFAPSGAHALRLVVLKHSLYAIDGIDIDVVLGQSGKPYEDRINFREAFLDELDEGLVAHLFAAYETLVAENATQFKLNSDEELKEVTEEVKKSS
jgi:hypothetical protein